MHDDELARLLTFPNACDRASGFFNARSPWRNCPDHRRKRSTFWRQAALARRNRSLIAIQEDSTKMNVRLATLRPHRAFCGQLQAWNERLDVNVPNAGLAAEEWTGVQGLVWGIRVTKSPLSNIRRYRSRPFVKVTRVKGKKSSFASGTSFGVSSSR